MVGFDLEAINALAESGPLAAEIGVDIEVSSLGYGEPTDFSPMKMATSTGTLLIDDVSAENWAGELFLSIDDAEFDGFVSFTTAEFDGAFFEL